MSVRSRPLDTIETSRVAAARDAAREKFKRFVDDDGEPSGILDPENPPLTDEQLAGLRPAHEVHPELLRHKGDSARTGVPSRDVSISLDQDVLEALEASGTGWRRQINIILRRALGLASR